MISLGPARSEDLIAVVKFMQQLKKHKGSLFLYKKDPLFKTYELSLSCKEYRSFFLTADGMGHFTNNCLVEYHPYIHIFHKRPRLSLRQTIDSPVYDQLANLTADVEWLKAQMKYPLLANLVRRFNHVEKQHKDSRVYLARFYHADRIFLFHRIFIGFPAQIQNADQLEAELTAIAAFRVKLISQLKNHDLIAEQQTRYLWKVIVRNDQLCLHLLIVQKRPIAIGFSFDNYKVRCKQQVIEQITKTTEKLSVTITKPEIAIDSTRDTAKDKRKNFNGYLECYFNQDFWFPYYRIPCKDAKKMLFGKGNDKEER